MRQNHMKKVTISLVTFNSERFLDDFCDGLLRQTFRDWELLVIDNHSSDASARIIEERVPAATISRQNTNLGYAKAHNLNISWSASPYILITNPDIVMEPDCIERLVAALDADESCASGGAYLLGWDVESHAPRGMIDSCGLCLERSYRVSDRLQGQNIQKLGSSYVFGNSGAFVMYRRSALDVVRFPQSDQNAGKRSRFEYFDEDFFAYKEDVDLPWRLARAGFKHLFVAEARAYHHRHIAGNRASWLERKSRRAINRLSYRNHLLTIYKNHYWSLTLRLLPHIIWFELGKFTYLLFLDRSSLSGLREAFRLLPRFRKKRRHVRSISCLAARDFAKLIERR